jgi:hypothetical protein
MEFSGRSKLLEIAAPDNTTMGYYEQRKVMLR